MRIITVYLKGSWARGNKTWDRGIVYGHQPEVITIADNEYGKDARSYPLANVARIEETGHW